MPADTPEVATVRSNGRQHPAIAPILFHPATQVSTGEISGERQGALYHHHGDQRRVREERGEASPAQYREAEIARRTSHQQKNPNDGTEHLGDPVVRDAMLPANQTRGEMRQVMGGSQVISDWRLLSWQRRAGMPWRSPTTA